MMDLVLLGVVSFTYAGLQSFQWKHHCGRIKNVQNVKDPTGTGWTVTTIQTA